MNLGFLSQFINADKIGGWVRAGVAALFVAAVAKWPILGTYIDPAIQTQIAAVIAALVVGAWQQMTKTDSAKVAMVMELANDPSKPVQGVITTNDAAGRELAASIPGSIESAGSTAAANIAKA